MKVTRIASNMGLTRPRAHQLQDIDYKQTARALTDSNITLSGGAPSVVDGVSLLAKDRILVTGQSDGSQNGIYYVTTLGAGSNGTWERSLDANATGEISAGTVIMVTEGTNHADTQWKLTTDDPITVGTTVMTFARNGTAAYGVFAVAGQSSIVADAVGDTLTIVAGTNLALTTNDGTDTLTITPSLTPAVTTLDATGNITGGNLITAGSITASGLVYPIADGTADQILKTNGSGTLSFANASGGGATVSSDTTTNAERLIYVGSTTTGTLSAVTQDSGLTYNPSTGLLTSAGFVGALTGTASASTLAADATKLATPRAIEVSGAVTGTANFDGSAAINIVTTNTADPTITLAGDLTGSVTLTNLASGTLTATVGTLNQNTTGSAATLTTPRAIALSGDVTGTANFNGSAGITIAATIAANSVALGTDTTGNYVATGAVSGTGLSGSSSSEGGTFTITSNATNLNTASTIVARDGSGNFTAGTITATLSGSATSATTAGTITSQANSATITAASANTANQIVLRDGSGNFSAGTITATATSAQYADLAEKYSTDTDLAPGTVVTVCVHEGHDVEAASIGDIAIGVVSTDPAFMMNSEAKGQYIGLKGRLPVRVIGAVAKGQVVFVDNNGCASTSINGGSMVGIALESNTDTAEKLVECVLKV